MHGISDRRCVVIDKSAIVSTLIQGMGSTASSLWVPFFIAQQGKESAPDFWVVRKKFSYLSLFLHFNQMHTQIII